MGVSNKEIKEIKSKENFRNRLSSVDDKGKRIFIFPKLVKGVLYKYRTWFSWFLLFTLFAIPFVKIGGHPLLMLNIIERKFILFGKVFWPQDFIIFLVAVISLIIFIILFTVVYGRLFCGWACPQTVFMELVFRKIEYLIDGNHVQQKKLAESKWTAEKIRKRTIKLSIFFIISMLISNLFIAYIVGVEQTFSIISSPPTEHLTGFIVMLSFTGIFFFDFTYFREQTCIVVCPYGRLQGVLLDKKSVVVAYDYKRGEPRELPRKTRSEDAGDCIDCYACVDVCPTGIDIRNGTQLECVNCTNCIDACDEIMMKINKPLGLVRFASEENIEEGKKFSFNARSLAYSGVLVILISILSFLILTRPDVEATITKTRGQLYSVTEDNYVRNVYNISIANKTFNEMPIELKVADKYKARLTNVGNQLIANAESLNQGIFYLEIPADILKQKSTPIKIEVWHNGEMIDEVKTKFLRP